MCVWGGGGGGVVGGGGGGVTFLRHRVKNGVTLSEKERTYASSALLHLRKVRDPFIST